MTSSIFKQGSPLNISYWINGQCLNCRGIAPLHSLCSPCQRELPFLSGRPKCRICALPLTKTSTTPKQLACPECLQNPPDFDSATAAFCYENPISQWIQKLKYRGDLRLGQLIINQALATFAAAEKPEVLIPIPMPTGRQWRRGFNQADWLCRQLARECRLPCVRALTNNQRSPLRQANSSRKARLLKREFAFSLKARQHNRVKGKHIALIDDVMTTGATLRSASKILKDSGARRVDLWIIARTAKNNGKKDRNQKNRALAPLVITERTQ